MIRYPYAADDYWLSCSCCGALIENTAEQNRALHEDAGTPYPCDAGFGRCFECFGNPMVDADDLSEAAIRERLGSAGCAFYDARIEIMLEALSNKNTERFLALDYAGRVAFVARALEEGLIS